MGNFGVYVHFPFCRSKCPYCDFFSKTPKHIDESAWGTAYAAALEKTARLLPDKRVSSIFFGGGTPSLASPEFIGNIISRVKNLWQTDADVEISLEGNPDSLTPEKMRGFRDAGVTRLSVGVQSFNDADLKFLGRIHSAAQARTVLSEAQHIFDTVSTDFIYTLPRQNLSDWQTELADVLALNLPHLSLYQLALEEGSFFERHRKITLPDEEISAAFFEETGEQAAAHGYTRYEVSNFAKDGRECRHNLLYWTGGEYVGIGAGACGRYVRDGVFYATQDVRDTAVWLKTQEQKTEKLSVSDRAEELILTGLRLKKGVSRAAFEAVVHADLNTFVNQRKLDELVADSLMESDANGIRATKKGVLILNALITELLSF